MPNNLPKAKGVSAPRPSSFEKYQDPENELTGQQFKFELWYVRHKVFLYKLTVGVLIGFAVVTFGYSILVFGNYLIFGITADRQLGAVLATAPNYNNINARFNAAPLQILDIKVLPSGTNRFDFVAEIVNPNDKFLVSFDYNFLVNGAQTKTQSALILPGTSNLVAYLGYSDTGSPGDANLSISNVHWQRIDNHQIVDVASWQNERLNFIPSDFYFTLGVSGPEGEANAAAVRFRLNNSSAYSYKNPKFLVGLYVGQSLVGVLPFQVESFNALETKDIDVRTLTANLSVDTVKIYPQINIFDPESYLPPPR